GGGHPRTAPDGGSWPPRRRNRMHLWLWHVPDNLHAELVAPGRRTRLPASRRDPPGRSAGRLLHGCPPAGWRRRRPRPLERAADPVAALDRDAARLWQYGRAETLRRVAHHRRHPLRRDLRGGGL